MNIDGKKIIGIKNRIASNFTFENWSEIGLLTGFSGLIDNHPRLLRSLSWGDEDYQGNVLSVLQNMANASENSLGVIEEYLDTNFPEESEYISSKPALRKITFAPNVFHIPEDNIDEDLIALMTPLSAEFENVFKTIDSACDFHQMRCKRASDIWEDSVIIQDIFSLIFRAKAVIVDFTGKNPNVMYELGIAHTLGKNVIPITQSLDDIPFDIAHHRALKYLNNQEGLKKLWLDLEKKFEQLFPNTAIF